RPRSGSGSCYRLLRVKITSFRHQNGIAAAYLDDAMAYYKCVRVRVSNQIGRRGVRVFWAMRGLESAGLRRRDAHMHKTLQKPDILSEMGLKYGRPCDTMTVLNSNSSGSMELPHPMTGICNYF
uniref:hypothetical protein n=1 Tax=Bifidobacterium adolescentis TaxID=1680 RepID=UPI004025320F